GAEDVGGRVEGRRFGRPVRAAGEAPERGQGARRERVARPRRPEADAVEEDEEDGGRENGGKGEWGRGVYRNAPSPPLSPRRGHDPVEVHGAGEAMDARREVEEARVSGRVALDAEDGAAGLQRPRQRLRLGAPRRRREEGGRAGEGRLHQRPLAVVVVERPVRRGEGGDEDASGLHGGGHARPRGRVYSGEA